MAPEKSKLIILIFVILFISLIGSIFLLNQSNSSEISNNVSEFQPNREPIVQPEQVDEKPEPVIEEAVEEKILNPEEIMFPEPEPIISSDSLVIPLHSDFTLLGKSNETNSRYCNELIEIKLDDDSDNSIRFGMENDHRCYKSIIVFDITQIVTEATTKDIKSLDIKYQGKKPNLNCGKESICGPPPFAEIKYQISNVPCIAEFNNNYFNNQIENWILLVREYWEPLSADWVNSINNSDLPSNHTGWKALSFIANDIEQLSHVETSYFLCMSLSQWGAELIGKGPEEHNFWNIQDPILILSWM